MAPAEALRRIERRLLETLDTGATSFSGERLRFLCANGPADEANSYAWRWARRDPAGMFAWFQENEPTFRLPRRPEPGSEGFVDDVFTGWARRDADAALDAALALPKDWQRPVALGRVVSELRILDPRRAVEIAAQHFELLTSPDDPDVLADSRFTFEENRAFFQEMPAGEARAKLLARSLNLLEGAEARQVWQSAAEELRNELVLGGFAPQGPQSKSWDPFGPSMLADGFDGIETLLREKVESSGKSWEIDRFFSLCGPGWAKRDLPEAFAWVQTHLRGEGQVYRAAELFRSAAEADFDAARAFWETLPPLTLRVRAAQELVNGAPPERLKDVEALIKSLPPRDAARIRKPGDASDPFAPR
jgi:hypothetical protein